MGAEEGGVGQVGGGGERGGIEVGGRVDQVGRT